MDWKNVKHLLVKIREEHGVLFHDGRGDITGNAGETAFGAL